jgi:hypothetical protein
MRFRNQAEERVGTIYEGMFPNSIPLGETPGVGSPLGRFTQLSASNIVTPRQTIKARALIRRLVRVGKNQGKINITKSSFLFSIPPLQGDQ